MYNVNVLSFICLLFIFFFVYRLACGIIARSSSLFQNTKKICACDGLTIWDEREGIHSNQKELTKYTETSNKICIVC